MNSSFIYLNFIKPKPNNFRRFYLMIKEVFFFFVCFIIKGSDLKLITIKYERFISYLVPT